MSATFTSREFNQDVGAAKRAAHEGPVFITDRGRPAHVLLCIDDYRRLAGQGRSLLEALRPPPDLDLDFDWDVPLAAPTARIPDLAD
jgi:prevent-host-death family protein